MCTIFSSNFLLKVWLDLIKQFSEYTSLLLTHTFKIDDVPVLDQVDLKLHSAKKKLLNRKHSKM